MADIAIQQLPRSLIHLQRHLQAIVAQRLWLQVLIGMALGMAAGIAMGPAAGLVAPDTADLIGGWLALPGRLFLSAIQFVVVPLVVASVIRGIAAGEGSQSLGRLGGYTVTFFVAATIMAVLIGLIGAELAQPGLLIAGDAVAQTSNAAGTTAAAPVAIPGLGDLPDLIVGLLPRDALGSFVSGNMLQIVIAAVIIGAALLLTEAEQRRPILDLAASVQTVSMVIVGYVLRFAPVAVFGLLAQVTSQVGLSALLGLLAYVATVLGGLLILFALYLLVAVVFGRQRPGTFLAAIREVLLLAFSTSSSAAVMPLSLTTAERKLSVRGSVARFVIPLGTTINMGGTALYQGVATLFLAQVFGVDLGISGIVLVVVLATGAAIGSPGTPGVGIVILSTILTSVGIPPEGIAIILGVDRILDMARTVVNVSGDLTACVVIDRLMGDRISEHHEPVPQPAMPHSPGG
jgi:Na+/H+-dicarboxylate symporter